MRDRQFNIRFSEEEHARLNALAKHYGIDAAALVRMLIKRDARAIAQERATCESGASSATPKEEG